MRMRVQSRGDREGRREADQARARGLRIVAMPPIVSTFRFVPIVPSLSLLILSISILSILSILCIPVGQPGRILFVSWEGVA